MLCQIQSNYWIRPIRCLEEYHHQANEHTGSTYRKHRIEISHFRVPNTLTFKMRPSAQPFLWKWVLFAWRKIISISKVEHLTSFWYIGTVELGNGPLAWFAKTTAHLAWSFLCRSLKRLDWNQKLLFTKILCYPEHIYLLSAMHAVY